jgi:hypothetical protein
MRRSAQFQLETTSAGAPSLEPAAVDAAIEEMVFLGGSLNLTLLGGTGTELSVRNPVPAVVQAR